MKVYFGKVDVELAEQYGDVDSYFNHNGQLYSYCLDTDYHQGENLIFKDTCGRYVPIEPSDVDDFITALSVVYEYVYPVLKARDSVNSLLDPSFEVSV